MGQPLPPKKDVVLALLERATVFIHLDPRRAGCVVPMSFKQQPQLVLQIGLNMAVPIPDLRIEDTGITCTLSFGGRGFWCSMPWSCVYAMVGEDGRGMVWPEDLPAEVRATAKPEAAPSEPPAPAAKPARKPRKKASDTPAAAERVAKEGAKPARAKRVKKQPPPPAPEPADIRQRLVAVPAPRKNVSQEETARPPETPPPAAERKPKRELPPYLRVVK